MSIISVQLGQCGNQVGQELFSVISSDCCGEQGGAYHTCSQERFFRQEDDTEVRTARAVLIDMEPKVITRSLSATASCAKWRYADDSFFCQKQGSGNNWANGYCVHGPHYEEPIAELVRREVERCDRLAGFFTMMSVAGGTGSGMGTYISQCLRDTYPSSYLLNQLTWPYSTGEVIVQNYNSVLTLSHLYQSCDAILVHENDTVHKICAQLLNIKPISFSHINKVIAHQLGSVLQPAYTGAQQSHYSRNPIGDLLSSLVCHAHYKLLSLSAIPHMSITCMAYSAFTWPGLLKHLRQMLISNSRMEEGIDWQVRVPPSGQSETERGRSGINRSLGNLLILRGKDVFTADEGGFQHSGMYSNWLPPEGAFTTWRSPVQFNNYDKSATLVSNSQTLLKPLDNIVGKAWNMFASRAYFHQYTKFGISEEDFLDSFSTLEQLISSYRHL